MSLLAAPYAPRQPQETVLYVLVKEHLDAFLEHARESYAGPLPKYVEDELFVQVECSSCGDVMAVA